MSKKDLGKKRVCPSTGKTFYDLNKDPIVSPYTGEILNVEALQDPKKDKIKAIEENEISPNNETENYEDSIVESNEENEDALIPEIDEESIPDLENASDDEIVEEDISEDLSEFDDEDIDELNEDDDELNEDDDEFLEDDVSTVIKTVSQEEDN